MGTWGEGNLDNDYALDELGERSSELLKSLIDRAQRPESREPDEYDYTTLFVEFEIVFALETHGLLSPGRSLLTPKEAESLRDRYIEGWDQKIDSVAPTDDHKRKRRKVIVKTFDRFIRLVRRYHKKWAKADAGWVEMSAEEMRETFGEHDEDEKP